MNKLNLLCALNRSCHTIGNFTGLNRLLPDGSAPKRLSIILKNHVGTASIKNGQHNAYQTRQNCAIAHKLKQINVIGCRQRVLLRKEIQDSVPYRGFKSRASGHGQKGGKIALWKRLATVTAIGGAVAYIFYSVNEDKAIQNEQVRYEEFKKAELGGDWTLIDHHGNKRSSKEFRGEWILLYFGFTHCPDICPEELEKLVRIVKAFDTNPKVPSLMPIFITLDPDRDTPNTIKDYLADFKCPRLLGFTAPSVDEIKQVATKYRAYFSKGLPDEDNDYIVDHTIIIYVINPKGDFVNYFDRSRSAEQIIKTVTEHIRKFNELEQRDK